MKAEIITQREVMILIRGADMPTIGSVTRTARIKRENNIKLEDYMEKEGLSFSFVVNKLIEEMDMPKSRNQYVNIDKYVEACERTNRDPQYLIDKMTARLLHG